MEWRERQANRLRRQIQFPRRFPVGSYPRSRRRARRFAYWTFYRWFKLTLLAGAVAVLGYSSLTEVKPGSFFMAVRHILAFPNCSAARAVGLAPARRGQPGYWSHHDRDDDGIACEPIPLRFRR